MTKIFIDPGHNPTGNDTGAVGYGLKEQDVTVEIALKLKPLLERNGFEVKMSRNSLKDTVAEGLTPVLQADTTPPTAGTLIYLFLSIATQQTQKHMGARLTITPAALRAED